ncbi:hypothetical protein [Oscillibacter sp.]|uniref:hypothetical protein n=1 Tax=Oscillibacter sp. TaxID=1945593 RepID=UPI002899D322|nr:hypothetical protein [Oscillibacter sp.]
MFTIGNHSRNQMRTSSQSPERLAPPLKSWSVSQKRESNAKFRLKRRTKWRSVSKREGAGDIAFIFFKKPLQSDVFWHILKIYLGMPKINDVWITNGEAMDAYIKRLLLRKIPILTAIALVLLFGTLAKLFAG